MAPEPVLTPTGTASPLLHLIWWRQQEDQCPRELKQLSFLSGSSPLRGKGWREAKGGNPGKPAESLESPFFDHFIPFFFPLSLLCEAFQDLSLSAGISGGQLGPQARTDGQAANQPAHTIHARSAVLCCQGLLGLKHRIIVGVFFCFFQRKSKFPGKIY